MLSLDFPTPKRFLAVLERARRRFWSEIFDLPDDPRPVIPSIQILNPTKTPPESLDSGGGDVQWPGFSIRAFANQRHTTPN